jgi:hypothetical protein
MDEMRSYDFIKNTIEAQLNVLYPKEPPTEEELQKNAEFTRNLYKAQFSISDEAFQRILKELRESREVKLDVGTYITDEENHHQSWLPARRANIEFFFWNRYKRYLEMEKHWSPEVTRTLGEVSDEILDLCGDPQSASFRIKGLVLGDIQSGKTANYTAICNKAADAGYRVIIILAGMQEDLRRQTQERLDMEFSGRRSKYLADLKKNIPGNTFSMGVGKYGTPKSNEPERRIASFTSVERDFNKAILISNDLSLDNVNCPVLFVVKKNKKVLGNLYDWLNSNNRKNAAGKIDLPMLLIDDEADNASVNTNDPDAQPTAINNCIRKLINLFGRVSYVGITATPFANIFIEPEENEDLFPSDFIYALSAPSNYIGAQRIFGEEEEADHQDMLEEINSAEFENIFPPKHKKTLAVHSLPEDLYKAAGYFLLVNAVRDFRQDITAHRSMMVHVSRFVKVQKQVAGILSGWLEKMKSAVLNYSRLTLDKSEKIPEIRMLHNIWEWAKLEEKSGTNWQNILQNYLYKAIAPIDVKEINSKSSSVLDYARYKDNGLRVIAVGGNSLSRGLTLEGLCVTYFYRNSNMYDTLLQMGRWFGYRPHYEDLVKIWLTPKAEDWYGQITRATEDLKNQIIEMRSEHRTPREFGLKVRQDPGTLIVTAQSKMRAAKPVNIPVSVSGHLLETPRLKADLRILKENERLFKEFINQLAEIGQPVSQTDERTSGNYFWQGVPAENVAQLLEDFETHPWHLSYNGRALAKYIRNQNWPQGWDVVLLCHGSGREYPELLKYGNSTLKIKGTEHRHIVADDFLISVSGTKLRVASGGCTQIGLTKAERKQAKEKFLKLHLNKKHVPDSAYLTKQRNPILMLHILDANYDNESTCRWPSFLFCLGVGLPQTSTGDRTVVYVLNPVELRDLMEEEGDE